MALKDLSRDALIAQALARGVDGAHFLTKAELLRVLGSDEPVHFFRRAREWLVQALSRFDAPHAHVDDDFVVHTGTPSTAPPAPDAIVPQQPLSQPSASIAAPEAQEPIRTQTMARLLAEQGHHDRARAILDTLPEKLEADAPDATSAALAPAIVSASVADVTTLTAHPVSARSIFVAWSISARALARAERVLGAPGQLALRVQSWETDSAGQVHSKLQSHPCAANEGDLILQALAPGAACLVAIGLHREDRFTAIKHVRRFDLPQESPTTTLAPVVFTTMSHDLPAPPATPTAQARTTMHLASPAVHASPASPRMQATVVAQAPVLAPRLSLDPARPAQSLPMVQAPLRNHAGASELSAATARK